MLLIESYTLAIRATNIAYKKYVKKCFDIQNVGSLPTPE